jgi:hypothetical protein
LGTKLSIKFIHAGSTQQEVAQRSWLLVQHLVGKIAIEVNARATHEAHAACHVQLSCRRREQYTRNPSLGGGHHLFGIAVADDLVVVLVGE